MTGIVSALEADYDICVAAEIINYFAFSFITPLETYQYSIIHIILK
jgi:hypothetical protein